MPRVWVLRKILLVINGEDSWNDLTFCLRIKILNTQHREGYMMKHSLMKLGLRSSQSTFLWRRLYRHCVFLCNSFHNGGFQTLFRKSVKFSNFGKIFLWIDSVSKMSHTLKFWATYASRGRRFCVLMSKIFGVDEIPQKREKFEKFFFHSNQNQKVPRRI